MLKNKYALLSKGILTTLAGTSLSLAVTVPGQGQTAARVPETPRLEVTGQAVPTPTPQDDIRPKLNHIMKEVSGTEITVTKKATVIKLDQQPTVINNNQQQIFSKAPGSPHHSATDARPV
jgi:Fe(3+) dicitrate transport protein